MLLRSVKGTQDFFGQSAWLFQTIVQTATQTAREFGLQYVELPKIEYQDLFLRGVGEETDIVSKELFHWEDRGGRTLCLRPEGTAQTVRFLLEQGQLRESIGRYFYIGSMFRAEKPQKGRLREFHQIGVEIFGEPSFLADIETIHYAWRLLENLNISSPILKLNSLGCSSCRVEYLEDLKRYFTQHINHLSETSKARLQKNPLRILDSKDLKDQAVLLKAPVITERLCEECRIHFQRVQEGLSSLHIPFSLEPRLVRGLDYYTRTTFEISLPDLLGSQDAVCGGGRYDGLVHTLSEKEDSPAVGLALGIERLMIALTNSPQFSFHVSPPAEIMILSEERFLPKLLPFVGEWRKEGRSILLDIESRAINKKLTRVNKLGIPYVLFYGDREEESQSFTVKHMPTSQQKIVSFLEISEFMKGSLEILL